MAKSLFTDRSFWIRASGNYVPRPTAARQRPTRATGLTKSEAEDLLDWLQANGYPEYHLSYSAGKGFTVSFSKR
jgi:hypothetical protein